MTEQLYFPLDNYHFLSLPLNPTDRESCGSKIIVHGLIVRIDVFLGFFGRWLVEIGCILIFSNCCSYIQIFSPWILGRKKWSCVKWVSQQSIFHFMCVHTKMYPSKFFPLGWNVLFRSDNKNIRWRKFCFAPKSERNIWKSAGGRECVRGDLSVLSFMDFFFFTVCEFCTPCWD